MTRYIVSYKYILLGLLCFLISHSFSQREVKPLKQDWKFLFADQEIDMISSTDDSWMNVSIPHTWNNKDIQSGKTVRYGTGWYKRTLETEIDQLDKQYFLRFEGVGQYAEIYLNGEFVGNHLGSYSAFAFDITEFLEPGIANILMVKVNNELNKSYPKDNFLFGIYGGIYRDVSLIIANSIHLGITDHASTGVFVTQKKVSSKGAELEILTQLKNETSTIKEILLVQKLMTHDLKVVAEASEMTMLPPGGMQLHNSLLEVKKPRLWNGREDPYLYQLVTELIHNDALADRISTPIGIRSFRIDPEVGFILNDQPYRLYGVCRHQEWQDLGNALLPTHHKQDMELIYDLGATSVRLAHYQQADYIYQLADSLGLLIWAEIPFVNGYKEGADDNAKQQMTELIKQNFNHPSIFTWGVHNEVIKGKVIQQPVELSRELHKLSKMLDPSRNTVSVSNIWWVHDHPIHELTDLQGFNQYTGWYGGHPTELENWIKNYHSKKPDIMISVSEYGAGGNIDHQSHDLSVPNPTGQFFPEGYQTYYHEVTWSAIEKYPFIWASYVWNMFDFSVPEWNRGGIKGRNHKGLITYDRKTKKDAFYWYKANWSEEQVLHLVGKRNDTLDQISHIFKAYCNFAVPELFVNGESIGHMNTGINSTLYESQEVELQDGENSIEVRALSDGDIVRDAYRIVVLVSR